MSVTMPGHESRDGDLRADLLGWIKRKRPEVENYLRLAASRRRLLINTTIIAGTLAAALTGPGARREIIRRLVDESIAHKGHARKFRCLKSVLRVA
jgi:hypothetical protein